MYKPPEKCLNDFDVSFNPHTQSYELIHLQGPPIATTDYDATILENSYGFATSQDLIDWQTYPDIFNISLAPDRFDNSAIWTMKTLFNDDVSKRFMFYTGVKKHPYFYQEIGRADYDFKNSKWIRHSNTAILSADPRWYQNSGKMAWRDPYVVKDRSQNRYVMFIAAKEKGVNEERNGCVAIAFSNDLVKWDIQPPLIYPRLYNEMECPVYFELNGFHYILVSTSNTGAVHTWRSNEMLGTYEEIEPLTKPGEYAARIITHKNKTLILHTQWVDRKDSKGALVLSRGYLADPKELLQDEYGSLTLAHYQP